MDGRSRRILMGAGLVVLLGAVAAQAEELADVRQVFKTDIRLFNGQDPTAFSAAAHKEVVLFGTLSPFAVKGKAAIRQLIEDYFAEYDYAKWTPVDAKFFVAGTSALAWGHYTLKEQPKVGPRRILHGRYTFTYTRSEGKWLLVALDFSPLL